MATNFELDSILSYSLNPSINRRLQLIAFKNACTKLFFFLNFLVKTRKKTFEILLRLKVLNENNTKKKFLSFFLLIFVISRFTWFYYRLIKTKKREKFSVLRKIQFSICWMSRLWRNFYSFVWVKNLRGYLLSWKSGNKEILMKDLGFAIWHRRWRFLRDFKGIFCCSVQNSDKNLFSHCYNPKFKQQTLNFLTVSTSLNKVF